MRVNPRVNFKEIWEERFEDIVFIFTILIWVGVWFGIEMIYGSLPTLIAFGATGFYAT